MNYKTNLSRKLADAQDSQVSATFDRQIEYRVYTEFFPNLLDLTARYFKGATLYFADGLFEGNVEHSGVIEIVARESDLQLVVFLAGDIKQVNAQQAVLVTYAPITSVTV